MDIHPAVRQLHTQVIIALSLVGRQPAAFAVPSRGMCAGRLFWFAPRKI